MTQDAIDQVIKSVKTLLAKNKLEESIKFLDNHIAPISDDLETSILLASGNFNSLKSDEINGLITPDNLKVEKNKLKVRLLGIMDSVDDELKVKRIMNKYSSLYTLTTEENLEKIHGNTNNLLDINWLERGLKASKSVCQVVLSNNEKGTGWLLEGGWIMTNWHVIKNKEMAAKAKIVLDFERDLHGSDRETSEFLLDPEQAYFSNILGFDYAYIKVIDNDENPISKWGHLEVDTFSDPQVDDLVTIIQHPKGGHKQIALSENKVTAIDKDKIFYLTDTEKGSSGAPVFSQDWKVVALHHAGVTEEEGGIIINSETGERAGANRGILIKEVMQDIQSKIENQ